MKRVRLAKVLYGATSILTLLLGAVLLMKPDCQAVVLCRVIGAVLLLCGIAKLFGYFSHDPYWLAFQFDLARGLITVILGIVMLVLPNRIAAHLHTVIGVYVAINAFITIQTSLESKRFGIKQWGSLAVGGVLTGIVGLIMVVQPFGDILIANRFIGLALATDGTQNFLIDMFTVSGREKKPHE